jgi:hypothetical protein
MRQHLESFFVLFVVKKLPGVYSVFSAFGVEPELSIPYSPRGI